MLIAAVGTQHEVLVCSVDIAELFLKASLAAVHCRFHAVGYEVRIWAAAVLMSASYVTVAMSSSRPWQLLGVAFGSLQVGGTLFRLAPGSHHQKGYTHYGKPQWRRQAACW